VGTLEIQLDTPRASDADRDRVIGVLRTNAADGRISHETFLVRLDAALAARYQGDLTGLTADLVDPDAEARREAEAGAEQDAGHDAGHVAGQDAKQDLGHALHQGPDPVDRDPGLVGQIDLRAGAPGMGAPGMGAPGMGAPGMGAPGMGALRTGANKSGIPAQYPYSQYTPDGPDGQHLGHAPDGPFGRWLIDTVSRFASFKHRLRAAWRTPQLPQLLLPEPSPYPLRIGRGDNCDLGLADDSVSRRHAELLYLNGTWLLRDLRSTNGTTVNGWRITAEVAVRPGDVVGFGDLTFRLGAR
jgi:hypothetical protein